MEEEKKLVLTPSTKLRKVYCTKRAIEIWFFCTGIVDGELWYYLFMQQVDYQKILDFVLDSGKRLLTKTGHIVDIGVTKTDLTEEDLAIERGFREIISSFSKEHVLYAEEEHDLFKKSEHVWVVDPISGTKNFILGLPHYSIVVAHLVHHKVVFAAVYDPSADELFTAFESKGAFLNGEPIKVGNDTKKIILRPSSKWQEPEVIERVKEMLKSFKTENNTYSMAVNYCSVACGRFDGILSFTKDSFPEFAGGFIVREAGGGFTNIHGHSDISPEDRIFIGGNKKVYQQLLKISREAVKY